MRAATVSAAILLAFALPNALATVAAPPPLGAIAAQLSRADRLIGSSDPTLVQLRYNTARTVEDELAGHLPTAHCRFTYEALKRAARAHVLASEGFDRLQPALRARGERDLTQAQAELTARLHVCHNGVWERPLANTTRLLEPLDGEAFFGRVRARVPKNAASVEVRWNRRTLTKRLVVGDSVLTAPIRATPGPGSVELRFLDGGGRLLADPQARGLWLLPASAAVAPRPAQLDRALAARLATIASGFSGYAAIWLHDLRSGRSAAWNEQVRFPAASTVKLGVLAAALHSYGPRPERSPFAYDMAALAAWSSNLAANRLFEQLGRGNQGAAGAIVEHQLRRLGATQSTYPGEYRAGTSVRLTPGQPPLVSGRTTTAADLGHILESLQSSALGDRTTQLRSGLSQHEARVALAFLLNSLPVADNIGLFRPFLVGTPVAQKNGWIDSARHTAAIVYTPRGPVVVVVLTYRSTLTLAEAQNFGHRVLKAGNVP